MEQRRRAGRPIEELEQTTFNSKAYHEQIKRIDAEIKLEQAKEYLEQTLSYLENIDEESDELHDKISEFIKEIE